MIQRMLTNSLLGCCKDNGRRPFSVTETAALGNFLAILHLRSEALVEESSEQQDASDR